MLKRFARWVLRHELRGLRWERDQWKSWAQAQERYRREVHGEETSLHERFATWFFTTYPTKESLRDER